MRQLKPQKYIKIERKSYHTLYESYRCVKKYENYYVHQILSGEESYIYLFSKFYHKNGMKHRNHYGSMCLKPLEYSLEHIKEDEKEQKEEELMLNKCG